MNKILFIVADIHLNGGGERVTFNMADYFVNSGYDVTVLSFDKLKRNALFSHYDKIKIHYLGVSNTKYVAKLKTYKALDNYLSNNKFDIIFGIGSYPSIMLGLVKRFNNITLNGAKTIGCEHSSFDAVSILWKQLRRLSYPYLNATVVLTKGDLPKIKNLNNNSYVIPNSVTISDFSSPLNAKSFVSIGRLSKEKRFDEMIRLFKKFTQFNDNWHLNIVGEGKELENLHSLIEQLELSNFVTIYPFSHDISNYYLNSSIFLMTSKTEGLPMVLLEAKSFGLPIISYNCDTGPRDIIRDNEDGYLIPMDNTELFLKAMYTLTTNQEKLKSMGRKSQENVIEFSPQKIYEKWTKLIDSL